MLHHSSTRPAALRIAVVVLMQTKLHSASQSEIIKKKKKREKGGMRYPVGACLSDVLPVTLEIGIPMLSPTFSSISFACSVIPPVELPPICEERLRRAAII
jgi:hypothetical protein